MLISKGKNWCIFLLQCTAAVVFGHSGHSSPQRRSFSLHPHGTTVDQGFLYYLYTLVIFRAHCVSWFYCRASNNDNVAMMQGCNDTGQLLRKQTFLPRTPSRQVLLYWPFLYWPLSPKRWHTLSNGQMGEQKGQVVQQKMDESYPLFQKSKKRAVSFHFFPLKAGKKLE